MEKRHPYVLVILGSLLVAAMVWGQVEGQKVANDSAQSMNPTEGPPSRAYREKYAYDGSNNMIYRGWAPSQNRRVEWSINNASLVNVVDATNTGTINTNGAHCLEVGMRITLSGFSDNDLNTSYVVATVTDADTITVTTANVTDTTYTTAGAMMVTNAPRACDDVWSIKKYTYDGSSNLTDGAWGEGSAQSFSLIWDSRTTYAYY